MALGLAFWILMLLWLVFGLWMHWPANPNAQAPAYPYLYPLGYGLLLFILILLLGWKAFGPPLHG